jgi:hypothetical protein
MGEEEVAHLPDTVLATGTGDPRDVMRYANPPIYEHVCRMFGVRPLPEVHRYFDLDAARLYEWNRDTQHWTIVVVDPV